MQRRGCCHHSQGSSTLHGAGSSMSRARGESPSYAGCLGRSTRLLSYASAVSPFSLTPPHSTFFLASPLCRLMETFWVTRALPAEERVEVEEGADPSAATAAAAPAVRGASPRRQQPQPRRSGSDEVTRALPTGGGADAEGGIPVATAAAPIRGASPRQQL